MEKFVEVPLLALDGAGEDEAFGGEHDDSLIFIDLEFFTGNDLAFHCANAEANTSPYGDAHTCGASDIGGRCATCLVEDACGRPESVFTLLLHKCVGY